MPEYEHRPALAMRAPGIDYDGLPAALSGRAIEPGDAGYEAVRHSYVWPGSPGLVIRPRSAEEVAEAVNFARGQDVPLSVRSGGHGVSGRSTNEGGIVIDLGHMNRVEVLDRERRLIRLEPGARWGEVAAKLGEHGLAMSSGDYGDVGVGGLATAGGMGFLARRYGLTIDHIVAAEIVLADGRIVRTDAAHEPDLFWAIRGAGGNFGIVTAFELEAYELGDVVHAIQVFQARDTAAFLENWGRTVEEAPREVTSFLSLFPGHGGDWPMAQAITVYAGDDVGAAASALAALGQAGRLVGQRAHLAPYPAIVPPHGGRHGGGGLPVVRSGLADHLTPQIAALAEEIVTSGDADIMQFRSVGGAVNDVPREAMAYSHRTQNFSIIAGTGARRGAGLDARWARLRPLLDGSYLSFETDRHPDRLLEAFPEPVLSRLRRLKARYDPGNLFNRNFAIPPAESLQKAS